MGFTNKSVSGMLKFILYVAIFIAIGYIIIFLLPILLMAAVVIGVGIYVIKKYKAWKETRTPKSNIKYSKVNENINNDVEESFDIDDSDVIDVDYKEVK